MINEYIYYYSITVTLLIIAFVSGTLIEFCFSRNRNLVIDTNLFFRLIFGSIAIVIFYSIFRTAGITVNILFLVLGAYFLLGNKREKIVEKKLKKEEIRWYLVIIGSFLFYAWNFIYMYEWDGRFGLPFRDYTFYSILSYYIDYSGVENTLYNNYMLDNSFKGVAYYHYFEMWITAFIANLFKTNYALTMQLVTFPFFQTIVLVGVLEISKSYIEKITPGIFIFCCILMFSGAVTLPFYHDISFLSTAKEFTENYIGNFYRLKFTPLYFFFIAAFLLFTRKDYFNAFLILLCIPIASFTLLPGVVLTLGVILGIQFFKNRPAAIKYGLYLLFYLICMMGFYSIFEKTKSDAGAVNYYDTGYFLDIFSLNLKSLITRINIIGKSTIQYFILYAPMFLILCFRRKALIDFLKDKRQIVFIVFTLFFSGLISWAILYRDHNAIQLFIAQTIAFSVLLLILLLVVFFKTTKKARLVFSTLVLICAGWNMYQGIQDYIINDRLHVSNNFLKEIKLFLDAEEKNKPILGGSIKHPKEFTKLRHTSYLKVKGYYLPYIKNGVVPFRLTNAELKLEVKTDIEKELLERYGFGNTFNQFVLSGQKNKTCMNEQECQVEFVKKYNLRYVLVSKGVELSLEMASLVSRVIIDESTGDAFYILKRFN